jgi:hypothetical protein
MDKETILLLLKAAQVEAFLIMMLAIGFKWINRYWFIRITFGLCTLLALTLSVAFYLSYSNGMVSTSPSHSTYVFPSWLLSLVLAFVGYSRVRNIWQFRNKRIFYQSSNYKLYLHQTIIASILFSLAPLASYISPLYPYRRPIFLIASLFFLSNIFLEYFVISKKDMIESNSSQK